ncbi:MAG TPA: hydrogenase formation protein HypD [Verrucomicrobia bacterium]|nr:hydrogenase formation protein HypD [Verrucomicrobiota bacterium]
MKHLTEYSDPASIHALVAEIARISKRPARIMEVCGGQTHAILRHALDTLLPPHIQLLHGPGCPVCVTPSSYLDHAIAIAKLPDVILCTFGDLLRVPSNSSGDLYAAKARAADIRMITSPLQALDFARENPDKQVVHLAIGFETTAPANAMAAYLAKDRGLLNFSLLVSQFLVPPILRAICADPATAPDAFLAAGHVCAIVGSDPYVSLARELNRPIAITGFEPADILLGVLDVLRLFEQGKAGMINAYPRIVHPGGNPEALRIIDAVFEVCDREWRGLGVVPQSGLALRPEYAAHDAAKIFPAPPPSAAADAPQCPADQVLLGRLQPPDCPYFGTRCTPDHPLGAPMVSPEGPCAAFFLHRRGS